MNEAFTLKSMIVNGWPVLSVLLVMSILSCTVIVDRIIAIVHVKASNHSALTESILDVLSRQGRERAIEFCRRNSQPLSRVVIGILTCKATDNESLDRAAQHCLQAEINELESYVSILGTIASTAPFVGLFGTVIGIIKAFQDIASSAGGGPQVVAVGIAEALITTSFGLLVAIPATMAYNYFIRHIQTVAQDVDLVAYDVIETLAAGEEKQP